MMNRALCVSCAKREPGGDTLATCKEYPQGIPVDFIHGVKKPHKPLQPPRNAVVPCYVPRAATDNPA